MKDVRDWLETYEQDLTLLLQMFASEIGPTERKNLRSNLLGIRQFLGSFSEQPQESKMPACFRFEYNNGDFGPWENGSPSKEDLEDLEDGHVKSIQYAYFN